jgi:hypothetical protein
MYWKRPTAVSEWFAPLFLALDAAHISAMFLTTDLARPVCVTA